MKRKLTLLFVVLISCTMLFAGPRRSVTVGGRDIPDRNEAAQDENGEGPKKAGSFVYDRESGKVVPEGRNPYTVTGGNGGADTVLPSQGNGQPTVMVDAAQLLEMILQMQNPEVPEEKPAEAVPVIPEGFMIPEGTPAPFLGELSDLEGTDLDYLIGRLLDEKAEREGEKPEEEKKWYEKDLEKPMVSGDLFYRTVMNRETNFGLGGGFSVGVQTDNFRFEVYALADYFLAPIGGSGGAASLELMTEAGATFAWKFMEAWRTRTYIELDVGYFAQLVQIPQQPGETFLAYNGIIMRPKVVTHLQILKHWDISMGIFYQFPLYPAYDDYKGLGVIIGLL